MKAFKWQNHKDKVQFPLFVQPKLNGIRMTFQAGRCKSNAENEWTTPMFSHIKEELDFLPENLLLDGELYIHGWSLQKINRAASMNLKEPNVHTWELQYHVFDGVIYSRETLMLPFEERLQFLKDTLLRCAISAKSKIRLVETHKVISEVAADQHFANWKAAGYEGMMYRTNEPYGFAPICTNQDNRWSRLLKRKDWLDDEFEIVGITEGQGRLRGMVGALQMRCDTGIFEVGSGLDDSERQSFFEHPPIGQFATIKYEMLSDSGLPLKPIYMSLRDARFLV